MAEARNAGEFDYIVKTREIHGYSIAKLQAYSLVEVPVSLRPINVAVGKLQHLANLYFCERRAL